MRETSPDIKQACTPSSHVTTDTHAPANLSHQECALCHIASNADELTAGAAALSADTAGWRRHSEAHLRDEPYPAASPRRAKARAVHARCPGRGPHLASHPVSCAPRRRSGAARSRPPALECDRARLPHARSRGETGRGEGSGRRQPAQRHAEQPAAAAAAAATRPREGVCRKRPTAARQHDHGE
eukprot:7019694-Prymnesium_polylepis.1